MTPEQYIANQLYTLLMTNSPGLDPTNTMAYANNVATLYTSLILPNLQVDLTTGMVSFNVPSGD